MNPTVLIIDDEHEYGADLEALLHPDFTCRFAATGEEGLGSIASHAPDAVVLDLMIAGGRNGLEILTEVNKLHPSLPVIMVTKSPTPETEAEAIRRGAFYYLSKAAGREEVLVKLRRCIEASATAKERDRLRGEGKCLRAERDLLRQEVTAVHGLFLGGRSAVMREFDGALARIAAASSTVLITGESGTGKSLVAREIHRRSARADHPVLQVNMGSLNDSMVRDELFGHARGAFTDAKQDREGYFGAAGDGTIILDEIGDLSREMQAMLLHVIEERQYLPVGSSVPRTARARLVAATNRDLPTMVAAGTFRADLLSRLQVVGLRIPPLREHADDIPELANCFLGRFAQEMHLPRVTITAAAMDSLRHYSWRCNNVRELRNAIESALVHYGALGTLDVEAFQLPDDDPPPGFDYNHEKERTVRAFQRRFLERAFQRVGGLLSHVRPEDIKNVADLTGIPPHTVRRILKELGAAIEPGPDDVGSR